MIISCEQCATRYRLDSHLVRTSGTKVRCSKCHHIFMAFPTVETAADVPVSDTTEMEDLGLDNFEDNPIDKIDADLKSGGFLGEAIDETEETFLDEDASLPSDDKEIPDLADELDKILGPDDADDASLIDDISDDIDLDDQLEDDINGLELAKLSEGLDDLFGEEPADDDLVDSGHSAIQEVTTEDLIPNHENIEVLDLASLDDDLEESPEELSEADLSIDEDSELVTLVEDDLVSLDEDDESAELAASLDKMFASDETDASSGAEFFDDEDSELAAIVEDDLVSLDEDDESTELAASLDKMFASDETDASSGAEFFDDEDSELVTLVEDDLVSLNEDDESAELETSLEEILAPDETDASSEAGLFDDEDSELAAIVEDDLVSLDEDDGLTEDGASLDEISTSDETDESEDEFSMEEIEKALDRAEATEDGLDFDLSTDIESTPELEAETDTDLEAETDPDLDVGSLVDLDEGDAKKIGTDTDTLESLNDDIDDDSPVAEETPGLDTVQIEDFEFDLENLDEIAPDAAIPDTESDSDGGLHEAEISLLNDKEDEAKDGMVLDLDELNEIPAALDDQKETAPGEAEGEFKSALEDMESIPDDTESIDLDLDSLDLDSPDLDSNGDADLAEAESESSIDGELDSIKEELDDEDEDFSLDTNQIESFHEELEGLQELDMEDIDASSEENIDVGDSISSVADLKAVDGELDSLEDMISPDEEIVEDTIAEEDEPSATPAGLLSEDGEATEEKGLDSEDSFALDTFQIESFDHDIESLDDVAPTGDAISGQDEESADSDDDIDLNLDDIEGLDLEIADTGDRDLGGDDFVLDDSAVEALDLESIDDQLLTDADEKGAESTDDDMDLILDEEQIESLNLELESTDMPDVQKKDEVGDPSEKGPAVAGKKRADVLNLDLERPDLDGSEDPDDGVDLPILDDLLAPAEVFDETLVDDDIGDHDTDRAIEEKADTTDGEFSIDDQLEVDSSGEDDLSILDLDDIDRKDDSEDSEIKDAGLGIEPKTATVDEREADVPHATDKPVTVSSEPLDEDLDSGPKSLGEIEDTKEPMPPGRFEPGPKKKMNKLLLALLVIVLLLGLLFGLNSMGLKIPGMDQLNITSLLPGGGQPADEFGRTQLKTADIKGKFVSNNNSGRLFVVTGQVLNQYDTRRGDIQVKGTIYATGGKQVASQKVLSGKMISDGDLKIKPIEDIKKQLGVGQNTDQTVDPGKTLPFMIVFAGLPDDIEEFSVEVVQSKAK